MKYAKDLTAFLKATLKLQKTRDDSTPTSLCDGIFLFPYEEQVVLVGANGHTMFVECVPMPDNGISPCRATGTAIDAFLKANASYLRKGYISLSKVEDGKAYFSVPGGGRCYMPLDIEVADAAPLVSVYERLIVNVEESTQYRRSVHAATKQSMLAFSVIHSWFSAREEKDNLSCVIMYDYALQPGKQEWRANHLVVSPDTQRDCCAVVMLGFTREEDF